MMKPVETFLSELNELNIKLWVRDDKLRCQAPEGILTAQIQAKLREYKPDIIRFLEPDEYAPIPVAPKDKEMPLSYAQQRLWFLNQFEGQESTTYNLPGALRLSGTLDVKALQHSLGWLLERHTILRSCFPVQAGKPRVRIQPIDKFRVLGIQDLRQLNGQAQKEEVQNLCNSHARTTHDLAQGPLFKADLLLLDDTHAVLLINMHHIITDDWSLGVFIRDLQHAYTAFARGEEPGLAPLPIQYSDYAVWHRNWLQGEELQQQADYWRRQLDGCPELLELPTDKPRPSRQSYQGRYYVHRLSPALRQALTKLGRENETTPFMTLLAAFNILLARYSGQADICVGSPIANRTHRQTEDLIGFFVNTLVMRGRVSPRQSFLDLLQRTRKTCLEAYAHQDIPFEMLVEHLQPTRSMSHSPLFQVVFVLHKNESRELKLPGLTLEPLEPDYPTAKFDLTLNIAELDGELNCQWEYATDLFYAETITRMAGHFETLLTAIVENPEQPVWQLNMLTEEEIRQLNAWNETATDYPKESTIVQLFEQQVEKTPDKTAVVCYQNGEDRQLTYRQLNEKANQAAHCLLRLKTQDGKDLLANNPLIAIAAERSLEMIIGVLAILKAGGAYLALDMTYPKENLGFMLEDSAPPVLLTRKNRGDRLPEHKAHILFLDEITTDIRIQPGSAENPASAATPDYLAYVSYTSGSTGRPKGVCISQQSVIRLVRNTHYARFTDDQTFLQFAPLAFDASTFEIWGPLLNGAKLVIMPPQTPSMKELGSVIRQQNVSALWLTAGLFNQMVEEQLQDLRSVRQLLAGGDVLSVPHVLSVLEKHKDCQLINGYGPTENTTFTCCFAISESQIRNTVPIGSPIANTRIHILDPHLRPVPVGVPGELHIAGDGLAVGYLNRPELTAEKFIPDPFGKAPGSRLYKTGDMVRYRPDGNTEFLGRIDNQVKIRGFRVELGEIETTLARHPGVQETVVTAREYQSNDKRLTAYIVPEPNIPPPTPGELLGFLKKKLPDYMAPSAIVTLEALPLNPNGKVDLKALPEPDHTVDEAGYVAPRSHIEEILAGHYANILRLEKVGIHNNFFELGGHSLLATQLVSRIRNAFSVELQVRQLFETPAIAELAKHIDAARCKELSQSPPIEPIQRDKQTPLPLSFAQERLWFLDQLEPGNPFYNVPVALRIEGMLHTTALEQSLKEITARHEVLRTAFAETDGRPAQIILPEFPGSPLLKITDVSEEQVRNLAIHEARQTFDLSEDPLLRANLLRLSETAHVLLLTMHHVVSDGWSMGVLIQELLALYPAFAKNEPSPLPELPVQYADFALWQREWLTGHVLETQLDYWKKQLAGAPPVLKLPTDRLHPASQSFKGSSETFYIDARVTRQLRKLTQQTGSTLFMTLLSAFATLLFRHSSQEDMVIGCPIANRNRSETESLIGFFVNTLALRMDLSGDPAFPALLEKVRQVALDAYAHQDLPFEKLVDELNIERDLSFNPLFQVMFALQNAPGEAFDLPDLNITFSDMGRTTALFDMVLDIWEADDGLVGVWEYNTDIFDKATIVRMVGHFQTLLVGIAADPEQPISALPLLTEAEKHQLLSEWNGIHAEYPVRETLHELFEKQVQRTPGRVAAVHNTQKVTYAQLNEQANQMAHLLRSSDIKPNDCVGILEERGISFLASVLGVLKAGGAFMPIDPCYPDERVRYMISDSQIHTLITRNEYFDKIYQHDSEDTYLRHLVCLDDSTPGGPDRKEAWGQENISFLSDIKRESATNPGHLNEPGDIAYMLYTSGSTGLPKGTMVRHNGAVNHIYAEFDELAFHQDSAFLQSAPSSSDISVWQFLAPLMIGGSTVIADFETVCDPLRLFNIIQSQHITLIELVPVVMQAFLNHAAKLSPKERALPNLEWAMVTGEAVSVSIVNQWLRTYPDIRLVNAYGPTEAADDICQAVLEKPLPEDQLRVPIGKPLANLSLYVLDSHLQPVPVGVYGEICVSGIGVGPGYWRKPEKTRACFVDNPYADRTYGDTIYRTGDSGRWRPDGSLEFAGRLDHQVKIRGFRIELGEIEGMLSQHPAVMETVVIDREDEPGDKHLTAYMIVSMQARDMEKDIGELHEEQVSLWQDLHEDSYGHTPSHEDPRFNIIGWDSTYTGEQLPDKVMRERVDTTADRILSLNPQKVLEIGCGTGLIMYRIVDECESYVGTDLSAAALKRLEDSRQNDDIRGLDNVRLVQKKADDFEGFAPDSFDTVIMNSVVQYFPSIDYLLQVLKGTADVVRTGGTVFIGDVRNLSLLKSYHTSVQFYKAEDAVTRLELEQRIRRHIAREQELAIDPAFFVALESHFPQISRVEIQPERGFSHNEMTRFRYDVILHLNGNRAISEQRDTATETPGFSWSDWEQNRLSLSDIRKHLTEKQPSYLALRNVANARLETENRVSEWLANAGDTETVGQLRESRSPESENPDPEALWQLGQELPYDVNITCSVGRTDGSYDVIFRHHHFAEVEAETEYLAIADPAEFSDKPWYQYANNPLQEKFTRKLLPQLRHFLKEKLPAHMIPSDFMILESFPLLPNGKVNRDDLPAPDRSGNILGEYVAPENPAEEALAGIWTEVLGLDRVGTCDNFFELGGHSLRATQVISRIHRELKIELSVRDIFNWPTIAELAQTVSAKSPTSYAEIEPVPDADHYPVSHAQRRLWVLSQMEGADAAYHVVSAVLLEGDLNISAFDRSFSALVRRHESLRTTFVSVDGTPRQRVHTETERSTRFADLTSEADPLQRARTYAMEDAVAGFDLEKGPLIRMSLLKLTENQFALLFNMHHIISDGWSLDVLTREFLQLYNGFSQNSSPSLPRLRVQYRDYALWQNRLLESDSVAIHRNYWHEKLSGEIPTLNLPGDFPRPPVKTYNGRSYVSMIKTELPELHRFCREHDVSLFMALVALVKVLFYRYTDQEDMIIGSPSAGRDHKDLENQIGFYVNTLLLRSQITGEISFAEFLQKVREMILEASDHQIYPFDRLVQELNLQRDVSRSPLFDVMVVMQNTEATDAVMENVQASPLMIEYGTSQFDMTLAFEEQPGGLCMMIWYNTDLFLEERIVRLVQHFETLLADILRDANQAVAHLDMLPESERQKLLCEFNRAAADYSCDKSLVDLFEEQVRKTPSNIAVSFENQRLTYSELNARATELAYQLRHLGIGPDVLAGICVERSLEMVVGILAVLKAGGAYVPLDPAYPPERLAFMLEDSQISVLLTRKEQGKENWVSGISEKISVLYLNEEETKAGDDFTPAELPKAEPENIAYVIYTSGSTGKPKGVLVTHANVVRLFSATHAWFDFNEKDVWTLFHSYAFDFSVWELWGALLYGGRLVVVPYLTSRSPQAFYGLLDREAVTVLNQTPSAFHQLIQAEEEVGVSEHLNLRAVIFGGEALDIPSLRPWFERHGDEKPQLVNMYGITETTVHVTYRPLTLADIESPGSVIGCAIPDLQIYILDQHGQPVPIGVPGELHIGGAGLAQGYLNRPELTRERFVHHSLTGGRLYKTGDLARYLSNGDIEYLGRIDNQVKIRGFRVELGEIESALATHAGVQKAVVREQKQGDDTRLAAYIVPVREEMPDTSALRRFLQDQLPDYMIPAVFIIIEAFPLTPSGKIDIRALPEPDQSRPEMETEYAAPQSELERTLAAIWQDALGVKKVGVLDNVFDLGAHSVMIIQVRKKLAEVLDKDVPVVQLFKYPTISALAEYFSQTRDRQENADKTVQRMQDRTDKRKMARKRRKRV